MRARLHLVVSLLVALGGGGCGGEDLGAAPDAILSVETEVDLGGSLLLDGSQSSDDDGDITSFRFIVADGSAIPESAAARVRHTFALAGRIEVRLIVTDAKGNKGEDSAVVSVREP